MGIGDWEKIFVAFEEEVEFIGYISNIASFKKLFNVVSPLFVDL